MLTRLQISNYALIENVALTFNPAYTTITGETGAGKSILLKALNLLMGERADTSVLKQSEKKCILEVEFDLRKLTFGEFFKTNELDYEEDCILRREFSPSGKSRAFVNDTPVPLTVLKELGAQLIAIHTQHRTLEILQPGFQLDALDHFAGIDKATSAYRKRYTAYRKKVNELIELQLKDKESRKEKDYLSFLLKELSEADLENTDLEKLKSDAARIENAEKIETGLRFARSVFENENYGPTVGIRTLMEAFDELKAYDPRYADVAARLLSLKIELDDIESEMDRFENDDFLSEEEAVLTKEKLALINSLCFKHNLNEIHELKELQDKLEGDLEKIANLESTISELTAEIEQEKTNLTKEAETLTKSRKNAIPGLQTEIEKILKELAMPDAEIQITLTQKERLSETGFDQIDFLFKTNKGGSFSPIKKVASGGELSRLMLAILSILSQQKSLPTLIFDEIDTGVSGEVASKIATLFQEMGKNIQLISITHLPQVAGKANDHLHVSKSSNAEKTTTSVKRLDRNERVEVIAGMMSGATITDEAKANATYLIDQ